MAKKVRKPRSTSPRTYGQSGPQPAQSVPPTQTAPQQRPTSRATSAPTPATARSAKKVDLEAEYPFVGKDLRRLGFTTAAMFAVLVVLNLVLNFVR
ncbi:MAG TPA: hypothetical protein VL334_09900 [Anaerolineae bacterium]|nr:hypothetical protein [Anaerolineae bacterium]